MSSFIYFQEFKQTQAIDWQKLIGNVGGYVGVCLGYTLLQIPLVLKNLLEKFIKLLNTKPNQNANVI